MRGRDPSLESLIQNLDRKQLRRCAFRLKDRLDPLHDLGMFRGHVVLLTEVFLEVVQLCHSVPDTFPARSCRADVR